MAIRSIGDNRMDPEVKKLIKRTIQARMEVMRQQEELRDEMNDIRKNEKAQGLDPKMIAAEVKRIQKINKKGRAFVDEQEQEQDLYRMAVDSLSDLFDGEPAEEEDDED